MEYEVLLQTIGSVGFPIACCCYLFYSNEHLRETIDSLRDTLSQNTQAINILTELVRKGDK